MGKWCSWYGFNLVADIVEVSVVCLRDATARERRHCFVDSAHKRQIYIRNDWHWFRIWPWAWFVWFREWNSTFFLFALLWRNAIVFPIGVRSPRGTSHFPWFTGPRNDSRLQPLSRWRALLCWDVINTSFALHHWLGVWTEWYTPKTPPRTFLGRIPSPWRHDHIRNI